MNMALDVPEGTKNSMEWNFEYIYTVLNLGRPLLGGSREGSAKISPNLTRGASLNIPRQLF